MGVVVGAGIWNVSSSRSSSASALAACSFADTAGHESALDPGAGGSCHVPPAAAHASDDFAALVSELPDLPIVIEHLAGATQAEQPPYAAFKKALALANMANTYIKVGDCFIETVCPTDQVRSRLPEPVFLLPGSRS